MDANSWLSRVLHWCAVAAATSLMLLVALAPLFDLGGIAATEWQRILDTFARDRILRRVTLASALGLVVTARIFFRPTTTKSARISREPGSSES